MQHGKLSYELGLEHGGHSLFASLEGVPFFNRYRGDGGGGVGASPPQRDKGPFFLRGGRGQQGRFWHEGRQAGMQCVANEPAFFFQEKHHRQG